MRQDSDRHSRLLNITCINEEDHMVHWLCIPIMLLIGTVAGFFIYAYIDIRMEGEEKQRKWWEDG